MRTSAARRLTLCMPKTVLAMFGFWGNKTIDLIVGIAHPPKQDLENATDIKMTCINV